MDSGDLHFQLICSFNSFYDFDKSLLILTHYSPLRGKKFKMDDHVCLELFNFMKKISDLKDVKIKKELFDNQLDFLNEFKNFKDLKVNTDPERLG